MAERVISTTGSYTGYSAAVSIDAANDYMLIQSAGSYYKINRNVLLGLASAPLGTTDSQSPTNKTFDNTNIYTIRDDRLTLQDSGDVTRQATFQLSGITAGQTRVMTLPDASTTLVGIGVTQTLTNKTLTSPAINGGTIANATVTVDAIAGFTDADTGTIYGVTITNAVIQGTPMADSSILPKNLLTGTGSTWTYGTWTPTLSGRLDDADWTKTARYIQIGKTVHFTFKIVATAAAPMGGGSTDAIFTLPVTASSTYQGADQNAVIGVGGIFDASGGIYFATVNISSSTTTAARVRYSSGDPAGMSAITSTAPMTWTTSDEITVAGTYQAA